MTPTPTTRPARLRRRLAGMALAAIAAAAALTIAPLSPAPAQAQGYICLSVINGQPAVPSLPPDHYVVGLSYNPVCPVLTRNGNSAVALLQGESVGLSVCMDLTRLGTGRAAARPPYVYQGLFNAISCTDNHIAGNTGLAGVLGCPSCFKVNAVVNSAGYGMTASGTLNTIAPMASATAFGTNMATTTASTSSRECVTTLGGRRVEIAPTPVDGRPIKDACLTYISPTQVNFYISEPFFSSPNNLYHIRFYDAASGTRLPGTTQTFHVRRISPGLFAANGAGSALPAAYIVRVRGGQQLVEPLHQPLVLGSDQVFLVLYGTGVRYATPGTMSLRMGGHHTSGGYVGGRDIPVSYFGPANEPAGGLRGVDQINVELPHDITGPSVLMWLTLNMPTEAPANALSSNVLSATIQP